MEEVEREVKRGELIKSGLEWLTFKIAIELPPTYIAPPSARQFANKLFVILQRSLSCQSRRMARRKEAYVAVDW